ncbi:MAG: M48 family metallopeptidase [Thalassotalea sp.]
MLYQLTFSHKRKTIGLKIKNGQLEVRAPNFLSKQQVEQFVLLKRGWINKKLQLSKSSEPSFSYQDGDTIMVSGEPKVLRIIIGSTDLKSPQPISPNVIDETLINNILITESTTSLTVALPALSATVNNTAPVVSARDTIRKAIEAWCIKKVEEYLAYKLDEFIALTGLVPVSYKVRLYKSRWGSCNSRQQLTFNALLALVPKAVFDYVIIHELCHLKFMNHSTKFWQLVAAHLPDYQLQKAWLKQNQKHVFLPAE